MFNPVDPKQSFPLLEREILAKWQTEDTFRKSLNKNRGKTKFVFFDGPPFANGLPHYGHILANTIKDAVTRYFSARGYYVPRTNGWDCHGLPVEYEIEKELGLAGKKDIEKMGIEAFNQKCRESVFRYTREWEELLRRIARWVDFDDSYATLENGYMESIWHVFKRIWEQDLVYQGHKAMHVCPRCETPLSNFEVSQGYKEVTDYSVIAKFKLRKNWRPEAETFLLAWTTTPWTLPGNSGLAVGPEISYSLVATAEGDFIVAGELVEKVFAKQDHKIIASIEPSELKNREYEPLFDYYREQKWPENQKPYRVVLADFVTTAEGTGIVHIAPAFGEDDLKTGEKEGLPIIQHVEANGCFKAEITDFSGRFVKGQDQNIARRLEEKGLLLSGENHRHSYPHCWRCDTPLLNYAAKSWFIRVSEIKERLLENNRRIRWQPDHIRDGRFGKWLENARDWSVSRNRFWGCALPIWECNSCDRQECVGSVEELTQKTVNEVSEIVLVRHGQTDWNRDQRWQGQTDVELNEEGRAQAAALAEKLRHEDFAVAYSSDLARARSTAEIILAGKNTPLRLEASLREKANGLFEGLTTGEILEQHDQEWAKRLQDRHNYLYPQGESGAILEERVVEAFKKIVAENRGRKILIVTHEGPLRMILKYFDDLSVEQMYRVHPQNCQDYRLRVIHKDRFPDHLKGDLHKPYIDDVYLRCSDCGAKMTRVPEVLDCWFESGAMPYAQLHYPFANKDEFEANFPADFIAEGLDQTRGWFYTLHVLSTILFDKNCFQNVIVNGILLAADGEKLSKRKKNYPDPNALFSSHGVDATRFFLLCSNAPLAQDVRFSEQHVDEIVKKLLLTIWNCYSFFVTYANIDGWVPPAENEQKTAETEAELKSGRPPKAELDRWILSECQLLIAKVTKEMDEYNLTEATRPILDFVDNLSNWYIRRSRRRFWKSANDGDKNAAYSTLHQVLTDLMKLLSPFTPFVSDAIYRNLQGESVHLQDWPVARNNLIDLNLSERTAMVRKIINLGHAVRARRKIKVRQPLASARVALPAWTDKKDLASQAAIIREELNVKELIWVENADDLVKIMVRPDARRIGPKYGAAVQTIIQACRAGEFVMGADGTVEAAGFKLEKEEVEIGFEGEEGYDVAGGDGVVVILDTMIDEKLRREGQARDLVRLIQDLRKEADYRVDARIIVYLDLPAELKPVLDDFADFIRAETLAEEIVAGVGEQTDAERLTDWEGRTVKLGVRLSA